jgi:3-mercaptopyruvate sulfurtransferase SseA
MRAIRLSSLLLTTTALLGIATPSLGEGQCEDCQCGVPTEGSASVAVAELAPVATDALVEGSFVSPEQLQSMRQMLAEEQLVIIDARSADEYAAGHIPGAINLPRDQWRTGRAAPGEGRSQYLFRTDDGSIDVGRYEQMLGEAGIDTGDTVVVYGNHAGKADGSVPAMILDVLGHASVYFLDGIGTDRWRAAGLQLEQETSSRPAADYAANPREGVIWNLDDVLEHLDAEDVVFLDTRSLDEWEGRDTRGNARTGRIPGAVRIDYHQMLTEDRTSVAPERAAQLLTEAGIQRDDTVVLYCQTSTRVSLPYLLMRDLGYDNVVVYDASMHEYANRPNTPMETGGEAEPGDEPS